MPRVSIVLTCFNHLRHLNVTMGCIKAQTFTDYEICALDDGSTDGTRDWLLQLVQDEPGLPLKLFFNDANLGTYSTLNRGIEVSSGELIAEFNDDDVWAPTKLEKQVALMDANPRVALVHTSGWFIDDDGARLDVNPLGFDWPETFVMQSPETLVVRTSRSGRECPQPTVGDPLHELALYNRIIASSVLVRRSCFEKVGKFNTTLFGSGDWEMWFRIAEEFDIAHIYEPLTLYRVHSGSASHQRFKIAQDDLKIREWMITRLKEKHQDRWDKNAFNWMLAHQWACIGSGRIHSGDKRGGRAAFVNSLKAMPLRFKSAFRYLASFLPDKAFRLLD